MQFEELNLSEPLLRSLREEGYTTPTPIQQKAIPIILDRKDLLGCAQTGTGKTAAFALPVLQLLEGKSSPVKQRGPLVLILAPTRELAIQIEESFKVYGKYVKQRTVVLFGGVSQKSQTDALNKGVDILVATPGRLLDLVSQRFVDLSGINILILDEADRMLDMGFIHDIRKVLQLVPKKRQTLFFSATMAPEIKKLADTILTDPRKVEVTPVSSTAEKVKQGIYFVEKTKKKSLLLSVIKEQQISTALVFTRTKHGADSVVKFLTKSGIQAEAIHGNKSQNARQRALTNFKNGDTQILVATDIAARGIDVDNLAHVINFEIPNEPETYVHRIGRTGRAGSSGTAFSFCDAEEKEYVTQIQRLIKQNIPLLETPELLKSSEGAESEERVRVNAPKNTRTSGGNNKRWPQNKKRKF